MFLRRTFQTTKHIIHVMNSCTLESFEFPLFIHIFLFFLATCSNFSVISLFLLFNCSNSICAFFCFEAATSCSSWATPIPSMSLLFMAFPIQSKPSLINESIPLRVYSFILLSISLFCFSRLFTFSNLSCSFFLPFAFQLLSSPFSFFSLFLFLLFHLMLGVVGWCDGPG